MSKNWTKKLGLLAVSLSMTGMATSSVYAASPAHHVAPKRSGSVVQLTYWNMWSGIWSGVVQKMVNQFNATHPGIHVHMLSIPSADGEQKLLTSIAAGDAPDVFTEWNPYVAAFAQQHALLNLDQFMTGKYAGLKHWFYPVAAKWGTYQGKLYAMPWTMNTFLLYYNKTIMKQSGLNPNKPPKTIAQLWADQAKEWRFGKGGVVKQMGFYPDTGSWDKYMSMFGLTPSDLYNGKQYTLTGPKQLTLTKFYAQFSKYPYSQVSAFSKGLSGATGGSEDPFELGKEGFYVSGMWEIPTIHQYNPHMQYGVEPIPVAPGGFANTTYINGNFNEIPAGTKHPQQAFEFIAWMSGYNNAAWAAKAYPTGGWIPNSPKITAQPAFQKFLNSDSLQKPFVNVMLNPKDSYAPVTPVDMYYLQKMTDAMNYVIQGQKTPLAGLQYWEQADNQQLAMSSH